MAVYQVVTIPDPVLRQKAQAVDKITPGVLRVLDNMRDTMYAADGIGLAAPQIGISKRIIVVDPGDQLYEIVNPEIVIREGEQTAQEGCLSVPEMVGWVSRSQKITVRGMNRAGEKIEIEASDILARAFQHEIDHLDGILFPDIAIKMQRESE
ncbi:Formylmethionine deformylase [Syntrophomonas zehnderi OL-4]|uniref:Peptide deformylase n=1 Tax=Syntrophomonas zehnderi OL-4 TaxID=690567 RepID=A0A0E3W3E9_9FIRM|nr:peptide deformylase [Syntrophomonas zehnderi]CFX77179.1 Formylmethionine deformylase [Syntrophomonas zehnderi OL-4]